jgi:hypothetical protein
VDFAAEPGRWAWIRASDSETELRVLEKGAERVVAKGRGWTRVALAGDTAWVLESRGGRGALLRVALAGGQPEREASDLGSPLDVLAHGDRVYWTEAVPAVDAGFLFVPSVGPRTRLKVREASGTIRTLGEWPGLAPAARSPVTDNLLGVARNLAPGPGSEDLLGVAREAVYVRQRRLVSTEFLRVPLAAGEPLRVASEPGDQNGVVAGEYLYWTAPSEEAENFDMISCVRRAGPDGVTETVTDWLDGPGVLGLLDGAPHFISDWLYRLPDRLAPSPIAGRVLAYPAATDGKNVVSLGGEGPPTIANVETGGL